MQLFAHFLSAGNSQRFSKASNQVVSTGTKQLQYCEDAEGPVMTSILQLVTLLFLHSKSQQRESRINSVVLRKSMLETHLAASRDALSMGPSQTFSPN